jgi:outer membrane protein OmpA-like peptidoglycan-associated protein
MNRPIRTLLFAALLFSPFALAAEEVLPAHLQQIIELQRRADKLAFGELGSNNYHLAKARAWLDLATSEYHQTDTSGVMQAAIAQAEAILNALEHQQPINPDMPMDVPGTEKVRDDLWSKIDTIKRKTNLECGQRPLAESEVQLLWAGHEKMESGWGHAESYARIAENLVTEAQTIANSCAQPVAATSPAPAPIAPAPALLPPPAAPAAQATPVVASAPRIIEKFTLSADALFDFNSAKLTSYSRARLDKLIHDLKRVTALDEIQLVGHTDRLRTDGHHERNQRLSEKRAERIRQYLVGKGLPAGKIKASGAGSDTPIVDCPHNESKAKQIICLQPNRRVEITVLGVK